MVGPVVEVLAKLFPCGGFSRRELIAVAKRSSACSFGAGESAAA